MSALMDGWVAVLTWAGGAVPALATVALVALWRWVR